MSVDPSFQRYSVNLRLEDFGRSGQKKLLDSRLLIVGCGALGATAAVYAAASGVGTIGLVDFDTIEISNLQRQVLYTEEEAGKSKATTLSNRIRALNRDVDVKTHKILKTDNAEEIISSYDCIIDAADNSATTYLIEKICNLLEKPYVTAGVAEYHAQLMTHMPGTTNFSDIFPPEDQNAEGMLPCSAAGVFGPLTGVVASLEASEAVKILSGVGEPIVNKLLIIDLRNNRFKLVEF
ncbi:MAG: HesA/MoeB/ThiF family protein [Muribaculum sp.]|nr:HesA/MoeB/ThiF family protein [Muribaculum sp.]